MYYYILLLSKSVFNILIFFINSSSLILSGSWATLFRKARKVLRYDSSNTEDLSKIKFLMLLILLLL